ncbi:MAG: PIG-L family deacetylase [Nanoarchaeota archaeon]|nr:PIG-L family deacetylase [Nanoarchaeota archaeon]
MTKRSVMVLCAHPDDEVIGVGGTIAAYAKKKIPVITIVFSYGEASHPWQKRKATIEMRVKESKMASKLVGSKKTIFLGLTDTKIKQQLKSRRIQKRIEELIQKYKPVKIFTHAQDDPHPDHKAIANMVDKITDKIKYKGPVYAFEIWNPVNIMKREMPRLYVDITKTFSIKLKAVKLFRSQYYNAVIPMLPFIIAKAISAGMVSGHKFAEVFYKVK